MGWYIVITEEMRALGLTGNDLLVYAALHAYSQKGDGCYYGGQAQLAERCGVTTRTLRNILAGLEEKGLVEEFPVVRNSHSIPAYTTRQAAEIADGQRQKLPVATGRNCRHIINNISPSTNVEGGVDNNAHARGFQAPSLEEVRAYVAERGYYIDPEEFMEHYTSNGWMVGKVHMKDWKATVNAWERRRRQGTTPAAPSRQKGNYVLDAMKGLDQLQGTHYYDEYMAAKNGLTFPKLDIDEQ